MPTNEQSVNSAKHQISVLKTDYMDAIRQFNTLTNRSESDVLTVHEVALKYYNYCENFVAESDLLGAHKSDLWANNFAEDCYSVLDSLTKHFDFLNSYKDLFISDNSFPKPIGTAFANMQRMVMLYLNSGMSSELKSEFEKRNLPIYGFKYEAKHIMNKKVQTILSFSFGVIFVIVLLVIAVFLPSPTQFQQNIFWVVLALAGGGTVATFPGFIELKIGNWLRAGGALAVFAIVYFFSPASESDSSKGLNKSIMNQIEETDTTNNNPQQ